MKIIDDTMWWLLVATGITFVISGLDDIFFDIVYWLKILFIKIGKKDHYIKQITYQDLNNKAEQHIAIMIACWEEDEVIGKMLKHNILNIDYQHYDIFIGTYPNDIKTILVVKEIQALYPHIHCIVNDLPGPSTKARNLNWVYARILDYEKVTHKQYIAFVFHDAEDVIHPLSLKLYNYYIPNENIVQIPVYPLAVSLKNWTHWVYNDEFAEVHTKDMAVRTSMKSFVPSAGVGTAFSREALKTLEVYHNGSPFSTASFTEDYDCALRLEILNKHNKFVFNSIQLIRPKQWLWPFGKVKFKKENQIIATRSLFQNEYTRAVKQRSRWILGNIFQEWQNHGWEGNLKTRYILFHDRKGLITHFLGGIGSLVFLYWVGVYIQALFQPGRITMADYLDVYRWMMTVFIICFCIMWERILQKAIATGRLYGIIPALLAPLRTFYGNIINMHALLKAYSYFLPIKEKAKRNKWDKSKNTFAQGKLLDHFRRQLGDILLAEKLLKPETLIQALTEQQDSGLELSILLLQKKYVNRTNLLRCLALYHHLEIKKITIDDIIDPTTIAFIKQQDYQWLNSQYLYPIEVTDSSVILALTHPTTQLNQDLIAKRLSPLLIKYVIGDLDYSSIGQLI